MSGLSTREAELVKRRNASAILGTAKSLRVQRGDRLDWDHVEQILLGDGTMSHDHANRDVQVCVHEAINSLADVILVRARDIAAKRVSGALKSFEHAVAEVLEEES